MIEPSVYGIFIPGDVFRQRLRVICQQTGCSANEAMGAIVALWMFGASAADNDGVIQLTHDALYSAVKSTLSGDIDLGSMVSAMFYAGLIERKGDGFVLQDFAEVVSAGVRLEQFDMKLEKKRYLDMVRKQKRRAELKAEKPKTESPKPAPVTPPEPEPEPQPEVEKPKKPPKPKPEKKQYAEFVHMTEAEYQKLISEFGAEATEEMIQILNNYKGSKGKQYKNDYLAIRSWVIDEAKKRRPQLFKAEKQTEWHDDNPF